MKPEMRHDERYSRLSYPARELFNGLITIADDEGRFRALTSAILGTVFPYDEDAADHLKEWVAEIKASGMVLFYVAERTPYGAFRHWARHQRINRPTPSELPPPPSPNVVRENSLVLTDGGWKQSFVVGASAVNSQGVLIESSVSPQSPRGGARSDPILKSSTSKAEAARALFDYWRERCNHPHAKFTSERRRKVEARMNEGYTDAQIRKGIDGAAKAAYVDEKGKVFDDIELICRTGSKLEDFMARDDAKPSKNGTAVEHSEDVLRRFARKATA